MVSSGHDNQTSKRVLTSAGLVEFRVGYCVPYTGIRQIDAPVMKGPKSYSLKKDLLLLERRDVHVR